MRKFALKALALAGISTLLLGTPASAYTIIYYYNGGLVGAAAYCDSGSLYWAWGSPSGTPVVQGTVPGGDATIPC